MNYSEETLALARWLTANRLRAPMPGSRAWAIVEVFHRLGWDTPPKRVAQEVGLVLRRKPPRFDERGERHEWALLPEEVPYINAIRNSYANMRAAREAQREPRSGPQIAPMAADRVES
jgi:hypothetical protein